ncbi:FtsX-like permease family protein [Streptomyces sp. TRM S81-3]|uniref:FtsX-like permease family protein n=1 Tax=Streptomyces griseicoloratus TaxID=2752516 RepID=A0A926L4Y3_9ACTN|nr:FtsX-like permease family protein [Streptomyces griseicoloratus]MBD0422672.1 FtsX-like permease family protein [Streptomyces griseicoloratus]
MSALGRVVRSGVARRRVPTLVIVLATMMAVTASVLGGALLVASDAPFDKAFARQHGSHLTAQFDADRTTATQLSATADTAGVDTSSGPFPTASVTPRINDATVAPLSVVGRTSPDGSVDRIAVTEGRWANGPGEIVLSADSGLIAPLGLEFRFPALPGSPTLKVVGVARSVSRTADGWVTPSQLAALTPDGKPTGYQMLYRFAQADSAAQVERGRAAVVAAVPDGAMAGAQSWLAIKKVSVRDTSLFVPFLVAFGVLGLVMSVLIVGNVVAGTVGTGLRRIGVLKAVGFTPGQVVRAYMSQALLPAAVGTVLGVVAGHLLAVPVLSETAEAYGTAGLGVDWWVDVAVVAGTLGVVALAACVSAWRAGRLRTVDALAVGRTPAPGRGRRAARLAGRLPLPRPVSLGLARPFARPGRTASVVAAVVFGAAAVTFATGLAASLSEVVTARDHNAADVTIGVSGPQAGPGGPGPGRQSTTADPAAVTAAIEDQPGTGRHYSTADAQATVSGVTGSTNVVAFTGDASWGGYSMVSGRWIEKAGEAVVPTPFLTATDSDVGDRVTLHVDGRPVTVRIVGEVLDTRNGGMQVFTDAATLRTAAPDLAASSRYIDVASGTSVQDYVRSLNAALEPLGAVSTSEKSQSDSDTVVILNSLTALLTLMLVAVAGLGVLNGVVLDTHERIRDLGVSKALGMTPRQTIAMVVTSVVLSGLAGGLLGVPIGVALHDAVLPAMGRSAGLNLPDSVIAVYQAPELALLAAGGVVIAVLGSLLPAGWAARTRTATALRAE